MRAGYDWEAYRELCSARARLTGVQLGLPFVSVSGPNYARAPCKILYVGKSPWATESEGDATGSRDEYGASLAWSSYWLGRQSNPSTSFWTFASEVVRAAMPDIREPPTSYVAWSNLAKVAQIGHGAPERAVSAVLHDAESAVLESELKTFKPDLVVLVSNDAVWNVATRVFGSKPDMSVHSDGTWSRTHPAGFELYWTRHPQGTSIQWRADHATRIGKLMR